MLTQLINGQEGETIFIETLQGEKHWRKGDKNSDENERSKKEQSFNQIWKDKDRAC